MCKVEIRGTPVRKLLKGEPVELHQYCWDEVERAREEHERRRRERETPEYRERQARLLMSRFDDYMHGRGYDHPLSHPPQWEWARYDNPAFRGRANAKILTAAESWTPDKGSLTLSAPTGRAKSASLLAWLFRMRDEAVAKARDGEEASIFSFAWLTGPELSGCRRRWKIGEESPLVTLACKHYLLILDELGFEPPSEEIFSCSTIGIAPVGPR